MKIKNLALPLLLSLSFLLPCHADEQVEKVVILGGGAAGLTAALFAGQSKLSPVIVEGKGAGQIGAVYKMENYPGFPEGISGDELVDRIRIQAENFGARFHSGSVVDVDVINRPFKITFDNGQMMYAETIILALGTSKKWLGLDSEEALKGKGVSGNATTDAPQFQDKEVVVVGGGDAALEEALVLAKYARKVTLIHRSSQLSAAEYLKEKVGMNDKIRIILDSAVAEIQDVSKGYVTSVLLKNLKTEELTALPCEGVFVSIGRQANVGIFKGQLELTSSGLVAVETPGTETSVAGIFAAGDISDPTYRKVITAAGSGCMAAMDAIRFLSLESR